MAPKYFKMTDVHGVYVLGREILSPGKQTNKQTKIEEPGMFLNSWRLLSVNQNLCFCGSRKGKELGR